MQLCTSYGLKPSTPPLVSAWQSRGSAGIVRSLSLLLVPGDHSSMFLPLFQSYVYMNGNVQRINEMRLHADCENRTPVVPIPTRGVFHPVEHLSKPSSLLLDLPAVPSSYQFMVRARLCLVPWFILAADWLVPSDSLCTDENRPRRQNRQDQTTKFKSNVVAASRLKCFSGAKHSGKPAQVSMDIMKTQHGRMALGLSNVLPLKRCA